MALLAAGCTEHGKGGGEACIFMGVGHLVGDVFPAGDGCNFCDCEPGNVVQCSMDVCNDGGTAPVCGPDGNCPEGPSCGPFCCRSGEHCEAGQCLCGQGPACAGNDFCASGGPAMGGGTCGSICCGESAPCPL